jgi:hypothetical protein
MENWTDEQFCIELGKQVIATFRRSGEKVPFMLGQMAKTDAGLQVIGSSYREKGKDKDENYGILASMAEQELMRK